MQLRNQRRKSIFGKTAVAGVVLGGILLFGAPKAKADGFDDCNRRIAFTEYRLHEAIGHYGYYSPQAHHWRYELQEAHERLERHRYSHRREEWREHEWLERREHDRYKHRDRDYE